MPYTHEKPCLYLCGKFEDLRKRLYHTNLIDRIVEKLVSVWYCETFSENLNRHKVVYDWNDAVSFSVKICFI